MPGIVKNYIVLSRKYRPNNLDDLIGQDVLATSLKNSIDNNRVPHAFLFHGIRGIGKTTVARILARCLNCLGPDGQGVITSTPCGICKSCKAIDTDSHLDVMEIDAASRTGVDDIREIIDASQYMPVLGRYKIFIIDEVHMLSKSAFNALLKTLEEPPSHVKFIFATTEIHKVPETILSRCMTFNLKPVTNDVIAKHVLNIANKEAFSIDQEAANLIASEADGSVRDALSLLDQAIMLSLGNNTITKERVISMIGGAKYSDSEELINTILEGKSNESLLKIDTILQSGADIYTVCKAMQTVLYKKIAEKVLSPKNISEPLSQLLYMWQIFIKQTQNIKFSQYPDQVLKAAVIIMAHTSSFPDIDSIIKPESLELPNNEGKRNLGELMSKSIEPTETQSSNKLLDDLLKYFPGSSVTEIG